MTQVTPKVREALLLALDAPAGELKRCRGGFAPQGRPSCGVVTPRTANTMQADGLLDFDQPLFPTTVALSAKGVELATALDDAAKAKAGAA